MHMLRIMLKIEAIVFLAFFLCGSASDLPSGPISSITLVTCNVLNQGYYAHVFGKKFNPTVQVVPVMQNQQYNIMPMTTRQSYFNQAFQDPHQLGNADIICLQEYTSRADEPQRKRGLHNNPHIDGNLVLPINPNYAVLRENVQGEIVIIYDATKFEQMGAYDFELGQQNKRGLAVVLKTRDGQDSRIGIINVHIKFVVPTGDAQRDINTLQQYLTHLWYAIDWVKKQNASVIVCGDFNIDAKDPYAQVLRNYVAKEMLSRGLKDMLWAGDRTTSYANGKYQAVDYIYSNLPSKSLSHYPEDNTQLLRHGSDAIVNNALQYPPNYVPDSQRNYFSDHIIIREEFWLSDSRDQKVRRDQPSNNARQVLEKYKKQFDAQSEANKKSINLIVGNLVKHRAQSALPDPMLLNRVPMLQEQLLYIGR